MQKLKENSPQPIEKHRLWCVCVCVVYVRKSLNSTLYCARKEIYNFLSFTDILQIENYFIGIEIGVLE